MNTDGKSGQRGLIPDIISLVLACAVAFIGAYLILPRSGAVSTLMLVIPCAFVMALLKLPLWLKAVLFGGFAYAFSAVYSSGNTESLFTGIICAAFLLLSSLCVMLIKKKSVLTVTASVLIIAVMCGFHIFAFGNPVSAFRSASVLDKYVYEKYDLSVTEVSPVRFERTNRLFVADIVSSFAPSDHYTLTVSGDYVYDYYDSFVEYSLMANERTAVTLAIREALPDADFTVVQSGINGYPSGKISAGDETDYRSLMYFDIYIPSNISDREFAETASRFTAAILDAGIKNAGYRFIGGKAGEYYRVLDRQPTLLPQNDAPYYLSENLVETYIQRKIAPYLPR